MKANESTLDRVIRAILGAIILYLGIAVVGGTWGIILDVIAVVALFTAATGFCLIYRLFGDFSTKK